MTEALPVAATNNYIQLITLSLLVSLAYFEILLASRMWRAFRVLYVIRSIPMKIVAEEELPVRIIDEPFETMMYDAGLKYVGRIAQPSDLTVTWWCYTSETGEIYSIVSLNQDAPVSFKLSTRFSDTSMVITAHPFGESTRSEMLAYAYALNQAKAFEYHSQQIEVWQQHHGNPTPTKTLQDCIEAELFWETHYKRLSGSKTRRFTLILFATGFVSSSISVVSFILTLIFVQASLILGVTSLVGFLATIYARHYVRVRMKYVANAVDNSIQPT